MKVLRTALACLVVCLSGQSCATCHQTQAEPAEKVAWWEKVLGVVIGSVESCGYDAARCNTERQSH
jgi:hypothetical protein